MTTFGNYDTHLVTNRYAYDLAESSFFRITPFGITYNPDLPFPARYLHGVIAGIVNIDTNSGQISYEGLALLSGMCYRSVIRYVKVLEKAGLITVDRAPQGSKIPNIYHLQGRTAEMILRLRSRGTQSPSKHVSASHLNSHHASETHVIEQGSAVEESRETPSPARKSDEGVQKSTATMEKRVQESQTLKQDSVERIKENDTDVVVVENFEDIPIFKLDGVEPKTMLTWTQQYGVTRLKEVLDALPRQKNVQHAPSWVASALKHGWEFGKPKAPKSKQPQHYDPYAEGRKYISGPYASYVLS